MKSTPIDFSTVERVLTESNIGDIGIASIREIKRLVDKGATLLYTHGEVTDHHTMNSQLDVLAQAMELIKAHLQKIS